jgi:hypothetical protein
MKAAMDENPYPAAEHHRSRWRHATKFSSLRNGLNLSRLAARTTLCQTRFGVVSTSRPSVRKIRGSSMIACSGASASLQHLARDDDVEALVADGKLADVTGGSAAARPGHRSGDQSLADIKADDGAPRLTASEKAP